MLLNRLKDYCAEHGLLRSGDRVIVACSGGADSMALTQLLLELRRSWNLRICIAHFEHGIRGEESLADARFLEEWCKERDLPFRLGCAKVPLLAKERHLSLETAARELRYEFLEGLRRELGYEVIATAHHKDDQAETLLMRLMRGTGVDGLAGILPRKDHLVRPLLFAKKEELLDFCESRGIRPRHDETNDALDSTRNRIRLDLLPKLRKEYNPNLTEILCQLATLAAEQREYLEEEVQRVFPSVVRGEAVPELSREAFCALPTALQRALLRQFLRRAGGGERDLSFRHLDGLRELLLLGKTGDEIELPRGWRGELSYGWMRLVRKDGAKSALPRERGIPVPGSLSLPEYGIRLETRLEREIPETTGPLEYYCDYDALPGDLMIRSRRPGDVIALNIGRKPLKKLFMENRIPKEERERVPLLVSGDEVLWVPPLRRSVLYAVGQSTQQVLCISITKEEVLSHDEG